jgi:acetyl esterase/lipase
VRPTRRLAIVGALILGGCVTVGVQRVGVANFDLWQGEPPGAADVIVTEEIIERSKDPMRPDRAVIHVRRPTLRVYKPARPDGSAVLVIPGGAYQRVVLDKEGDETARRLAEAGVTAAVLVYRLPEDGWAAGREAPLHDAQRAMRLIRSWSGIDIGRVGVLGFSAGGNLAARLALIDARQNYEARDALDQLSTKPDFVGLIYAAYLDGEGSPALALGPGAPPDLIAGVGRTAPPMFILHAADDASVPVGLSVQMYAALKAADVPAELHIFPEGGHGFGIARAAGKPVAIWPDLFLAWGRARGLFR